jgi:hypothetical protein
MTAMLKQAMRQPNRPVAVAIVDDAGLLIAYPANRSAAPVHAAPCHPQGLHRGDHGNEQRSFRRGLR